ncbi:MAG TPA: hypothetical protein VHU83_03620 [Bryobacteraceae bacterium]|nr:hypothetical protein [Bryobacteraceae bacterium]
MLIVALVALEYPRNIAGRTTLLPLPAALLVAYMMTHCGRVLETSLSSATMAISISYLFALVASLIFSFWILELTPPSRELEGLALSFTGLVAIQRLLAKLDQASGTTALFTNSVVIGDVDRPTAPICFLVLALAYAVLAARDLTSPLYAAGRIESAGAGGAQLIPTSRFTLLFLLSTRLTLGVFLMATFAVNYGVVDSVPFGFDRVFDVIACLALLETFRSCKIFESRTFFATVAGLCSPPALFVLLKELLSHIQRAEWVGDMRSLLFWLVVLGLILASRFAPKLVATRGK